MRVFRHRNVYWVAGLILAFFLGWAWNQGQANRAALRQAWGSGHWTARTEAQRQRYRWSSQGQTVQGYPSVQNADQE